MTVFSAELDATLQEAADIRTDLNEKDWKEFREFQSVYGALFGRQATELKLLNDLLYYQGGYPSPKSPPKHEELGKRFGKAFMLLYQVGRHEDLTQHLADFGLEVRVVDAEKLKMPLKFSEPPAIMKTVFKKYGLPKPKKWTARHLLGILTDHCCSLQGVICGKANVIKKQLYPQAKRLAGDLEKGHFRETVRIRTRVNKIEKNPFSKNSSRLQARIQANGVRIEGYRVATQVALRKSVPPKE